MLDVMGSNGDGYSRYKQDLALIPPRRSNQSWSVSSVFSLVLKRLEGAGELVLTDICDEMLISLRHRRQRGRASLKQK
jgi:hypothetical protein